MPRILTRGQHWLGRETRRPAIDYALLVCILLVFFFVILALSNGGLDSFLQTLVAEVAGAIH